MSGSGDNVSPPIPDESEFIFTVQFTETMMQLFIVYVIAIVTFVASFSILSFVPRRVKSEVRLLKRGFAWMIATSVGLVAFRITTLGYKLSINEPVIKSTVYGFAVPAAGLVAAMFGALVPGHYGARWIIAGASITLIVADTCSQVYIHERLLCVRDGRCMNAMTKSQPYLDDEGTLHLLSLGYQLALVLDVWTLLIDAYLMIAGGCCHMRYSMRLLANAPEYVMVPKFVRNADVYKPRRRTLKATYSGRLHNDDAVIS